MGFICRSMAGKTYEKNNKGTSRCHHNITIQWTLFREGDVHVLAKELSTWKLQPSPSYLFHTIKYRKPQVSLSTLPWWHTSNHLCSISKRLLTVKSTLQHTHRTDMNMTAKSLASSKSIIHKHNVTCSILLDDSC